MEITDAQSGVEGQRHADGCDLTIDLLAGDALDVDDPLLTVDLHDLALPALQSAHTHEPTAQQLGAQASQYCPQEAPTVHPFSVFRPLSSLIPESA